MVLQEQGTGVALLSWKLRGWKRYTGSTVYEQRKRAEPKKNSGVTAALASDFPLVPPVGETQERASWKSHLEIVCIHMVSELPRRVGVTRHKFLAKDHVDNHDYAKKINFS